MEEEIRKLKIALLDMEIALCEKELELIDERAKIKIFQIPYPVFLPCFLPFWL